MLEAARMFETARKALELHHVVGVPNLVLDRMLSTLGSGPIGETLAALSHDDAIQHMIHAMEDLGFEQADSLPITDDELLDVGNTMIGFGEAPPWFYNHIVRLHRDAASAEIRAHAAVIAWGLDDSNEEVLDAMRAQRSEGQWARAAHLLSSLLHAQTDAFTPNDEQYPQLEAYFLGGDIAPLVQGLVKPFLALTRYRMGHIDAAREISNQALTLVQYHHLVSCWPNTFEAHCRIHVDDATLSTRAKALHTYASLTELAGVRQQRPFALALQVDNALWSGDGAKVRTYTSRALDAWVGLGDDCRRDLFEATHVSAALTGSPSFTASTIHDLEQNADKPWVGNAARAGHRIIRTITATLPHASHEQRSILDDPHAIAAQLGPDLVEWLLVRRYQIDPVYEGDQLLRTIRSCDAALREFAYPTGITNDDALVDVIWDCDAMSLDGLVKTLIQLRQSSISSSQQWQLAFGAAIDGFHAAANDILQIAKPRTMIGGQAPEVVQVHGVCAITSGWHTVEEVADERHIVTDIIGPGDVLVTPAHGSVVTRIQPIRGMVTTRVLMLDEHYTTGLDGRAKRNTTLGRAWTTMMSEANQRSRMLPWHRPGTTLASRIASWIVNLADRHGVPTTDGIGIDIDLQVTRVDIARVMGSERSRISTEMGTLARAGIVHVDRHGIRVLNTAALQALATAGP